MANTSVCNDTSEAVELCESLGLYLKPVAKINICAQLPQLKTPGKTISNWEVMEKLKHMIRPETFLTIKVVKSTMEFIRLEGEIENKSKLALLIIKLDGKTIKLSGFPESLKVRAAEAKVAFPVRHDWDSYFRDAKNMNELHPGERPDTIYLKDLPTRWFSKRSGDNDSQSSGGSKLRPNKEILCKVFETFGEVRCLDIPMLDPYRKEIMGQIEKPGTIQTFNYGQDIQFDAYVQFKEYFGFVKAMDALRGMKLMFKEDEGKAHTASIKVEFDKTRHLSEKMIHKRQQERERLQAVEALRLEEARLAKQEEERKKEEERLQKLEEEKAKQQKKEEKQRLKAERRKERAEKRRQRRLEKKQKEEEAKMRRKIAMEERRLLIAQRKLQSLRLLSALFEAVKEDLVREEVMRQEVELEEQRQQEVLAEQRHRLEEEQRKAEACLQKKLQMRQQEQELREKILRNFLAREQREKERQREELRLKLSGSDVRLKSAVVTMKSGHSQHSPSPSDCQPDQSCTLPLSSKECEDREPFPEQKEEPSSSVKGDTKERRAKKEEDGDVEIVEVPEKNVSIIEILSSSDEGGEGDGGSCDRSRPPKKQKKESTLEQVLKSNKLRAWGGASRHPEEEIPHRMSLPRPSSLKRQQINVHIRRTTTRKRGKKDSHSADRKEGRKEKSNFHSQEDSDSDSGDSMVIPPPRSTFAPPDDPVNFLPSLMHSPWCGPYHAPGSMSHSWGSPHPLGFRSSRWGRSRGPGKDQRQRGSVRNFHTFKANYLKKYNSVRQQHSEGRRRSRHSSPRTSSSPGRPGPKSVASSVSYNRSQKLTTKKDTDGRYMYPLS